MTRLTWALSPLFVQLLLPLVAVVNSRLLSRAVVKQITFYFGDSNLMMDKYLQKKVAEDAEGWVKLDHIASFKRMQSLVPSSDVAVIGNILKSSDQDTVEVSLIPWPLPPGFPIVSPRA